MAFIASTTEKGKAQWTSAHNAEITYTVAENPYDAERSYVQYHSCAVLPIKTVVRGRKPRARKPRIEYLACYCNANNNMHVRVARIDKERNLVAYTIYGERDNPLHYVDSKLFLIQFPIRTTI